MKGKKAAQAANRRNWNEIVQRAEAAEERAEKAERALADLQKAHETKVSDLIRQRDDASSPALKAATSRVAELSEQLDAGKAQARAYKDAHEQLRYVLLGLYEERGYALPDVDIALMNLADRVGAEGLFKDVLADHERKRKVDMTPVIRATAKKRGRIYGKGREAEVEQEMSDFIKSIASSLGPVGKARL